uniref:Fuzzy n=1 Tax=Timema bartmani TaxID=61472 RepID=A0A7R9EZ02_9NEOP|nr:unnamed protein product [Timema bartmani]
MAAHIMCLTAAGGLPLFTRRKGDGEALPFSVVASLNGVHMFGKSQDVILKSTSTQDMTAVWKNVEDSVTLIAIASGASEALLNHLLKSVFNAMVLTVGINELKSPRNADRLKRELRVCYPLLDRLLECLDGNDRTTNRTDLLGLVEVIMCPENHLLQSCLEAYAECLDSLYGCVMVHGRVAVATESWWCLDAEEKKLLALLVDHDTTTTARDIPVFLPCKSPAVPFRLVTVSLVGHVEVSVLCGPSPPLSEVERVATQCWRGATDILRSAEQCYPRNFPPSIQLDTGVMGLLLIDHECGKFMLSRNQHPDSAGHETRSLNSAHRLDVLRTFYHQVATPFFSHNDEGNFAEKSPVSSQALETYWCSEYHKCHALRSGGILLCMLYTSAVPIQTMRATITVQEAAVILTGFYDRTCSKDPPWGQIWLGGCSDRNLGCRLALTYACTP